MRGAATGNHRTNPIEYVCSDISIPSNPSKNSLKSTGAQRVHKAVRGTDIVFSRLGFQPLSATRYYHRAISQNRVSPNQPFFHRRARLPGQEFLCARDIWFGIDRGPVTDSPVSMSNGCSLCIGVPSLNICFSALMKAWCRAVWAPRVHRCRTFAGITTSKACTLASSV